APTGSKNGNDPPAEGEEKDDQESETYEPILVGGRHVVVVRGELTGIRDRLASVHGHDGRRHSGGPRPVAEQRMIQVQHVGPTGQAGMQTRALALEPLQHESTTAIGEDGYGDDG